MDIESDDAVLRILADGEDMDYTKWPELLTRLITRLEKIVHEQFPIPSSQRAQPIPPSQPIPSSPPPPSSLQPRSEGEISSQESAGSSGAADKENAPPVNEEPVDTLPPQIRSLLNSTIATLTTFFSQYPPHTIQRLAELILSPRQHYKSLYSYIHAVDRVVHVTSGANGFPLPPAVPDLSAASVLSNGLSSTDPLSISWGKPASTAQATLGSDESLGGALLTPIPWLNKNGNHVAEMEGEVRTESTETIEGPNGPGGVETVSVSVNGISSATAANTSLSTSPETGSTNLRAEGGVTQGELLRQEQRAGVVPAAQLAGHNRGDADGVGEEDDAPHARGPDEIGMEDMGPQATNSAIHGGIGLGATMQGIDVEAAVGRKAEDNEVTEKDEKSSSTPKREAEEDLGANEKRLKEGQPEQDAEVKAGDESVATVTKEDASKEETRKPDIEMVDADGKSEKEKKIGESGENIGADAIDTSTI
ncbi:hypothetical protein PVAG01_05199 [Phlyctema vagabunda]|uniref:Uncharacterized protein n=1 Tax=Phlyctema vagabunda TaxID=108571 RepID=A0ABR4PJD8_9HELO